VVVHSLHRDRLYGAAHLGVIIALLTLGLFPFSAAYLAASALLGWGLGVNNLVNMDRISRAPVDKAKVSSHLTLLGMAGGTLGALTVGQLSDSLGLQPVFLILTLPWVAAWLLCHGQALLPHVRRSASVAKASPIPD